MGVQRACLHAELTQARLHRLRASRRAEIMGRTSKGSRFQSAARPQHLLSFLSFGSGNFGCTMIARDDVDLASNAIASAAVVTHLVADGYEAIATSFPHLSHYAIPCYRSGTSRAAS